MRDDSADLRFAASLVGRSAGEVAACTIPPEALSDTKARALYAATVAVSGRVSEPTAEDVIAELAERGTLAAVGGPEQVHILAALYGLEAPESLRREVLRGACLRAAAEASARLLMASKTGKAEEAAEAMAEALQSVQRYQSAERAAPMLTHREHLEALIESLDDYAKGRKELPRSAQLGPFTAALGVPQPGALVVIGGYSHAGKSFLMQHLERCYHAIGYGTLRLSLEDPDVVNRARLGSEVANASISLSSPTRQAATEMLSALCATVPDGYGRAKAPRIIHTPESRDVYAIMRDMRRGAVEYGCKVVFVDYAQIVTVPGSFDARASVAATVSMLKAEAMRLGVTLVLGSQLRKPATGGDREPSPHDLKDASELHHAAEVLVLCWFEEHGTEENPKRFRIARIAKDKLAGTSAYAWVDAGPGGVVREVIPMKRSANGEPQDARGGWERRLPEAFGDAAE